MQNEAGVMSRPDQFIAKSDNVLITNNWVAKIATLDRNKTEINNRFSVSINNIENTEQLLIAAIPLRYANNEFEPEAMPQIFTAKVEESFSTSLTKPHYA